MTDHYYFFFKDTCRYSNISVCMQSSFSSVFPMFKLNTKIYMVNLFLNIFMQWQTEVQLKFSKLCRNNHHKILTSVINAKKLE